MPDITKNIYKLNESEKQTITTNNEKIEINIVLNQDNNETGQVKGIVKDVKGNVLSGVKAQLISQDNTLFLTSISDETGTFYFNNVKENAICKIFLSMTGKETHESSWFKVVEFFECKELSFILVESQLYSIIIGSFISNQYSIGNIEIALFSLDLNGNSTLVSVVRTNDLGQFIFSDVNIGNYLVQIENDQIGNVSSNIQITAYGQISQVQLNG